MPQSREPRIVGALGGTDNRMSLWSRCHATRVSRSGEQPAVETRRGNIAPINPGPSCVFHPSPTAPRLFPGTGTVDEAWKTRRLRCAFEGGSRIATAASGGTSPESNGRWSSRLAVQEEGAGRNIAHCNSVPSSVYHPSPTAPRLFPGTGTVDEAWKTRRLRCSFRRRHADRRRRSGEHRPNQTGGGVLGWRCRRRATAGTSPVSMSSDIIRKPTPRRHEYRPSLDQRHHR